MELLRRLWSVAFNGMLGTLVRLAMPTTMYVRPLWVGVDCVEVGTCAAISLCSNSGGSRVCRMENRRLLHLHPGGLFRFVRLLRFERFCVMRYGENGAPGALQQYINGPSGPVLHADPEGGSTICAAAAIVAAWPSILRGAQAAGEAGR